MPSGTETLELPFSRMRLLKNDNRGAWRSFSLEEPWREGKFGEEGICLIRFRTSPMTARNVVLQVSQVSRGFGKHEAASMQIRADISVALHR